MDLGWIDFSDNDRKKTMDVLRLFQEQGAVDELGIGIIRDGFSNCFFPGTSTIQTRAKYFFIIPYAMMETVFDSRVTSVAGALRRLDEIEKETAVLLKKASGEKGVIGATVLPKWVVRTPSTIYWSGLRTLGFFDGKGQNITIPEYFRIALKLRDEKKASIYGNHYGFSDEKEHDDSYAGDFLFMNFWRLSFKKNWRENLSIDLNKSEADILSSNIKRLHPNTIFAKILEQSIDVEQFETFNKFSYYIKPELNQENAYLLELADNFSKFISIAQIRYNLMLSDWQNDTAREQWEKERRNFILYATNVDIDAIFARLHLNNHGLRTFLRIFKKAILFKDWETVDKAILEQEVRIKGSRSKLKNKSKYSPDKWIGGLGLDYRFTDARRLILDIRKGGKHV